MPQGARDQGEAAVHLGALLAAAARRDKGAKDEQRRHRPMRERGVGSSSAIRVSQIRQCYKQCTWRHDRSLADELIRHKDSKGGRAQRGFVEGLVTRTNGVAPLLEIIRDDINDEVKRRKKKKKKEVKRPLNRLPEMLLQSYKQRRIGREQDPPMLSESIIRSTRRHESVDLCEDADGDGSDDKDAEDEDAAADDGDYERRVN
ncbi:hypothetical protein THAOC_29766 [Thalassiosira oceanica]|uniref:Uncharacterized protein n=1 Tax=Thalassiosira oceanica TaxID=159749 RepID=K0RWG8_THAOC|nr:hypothetical protein THAOC_29766 [Thalassiosira oceanica]|eukprot:EJK51097.1 hypothetical protein THAOC_29766 [Thalassiosira oceanica]